MKASFPAEGSRVCEDAAATQALGRELGAALEAGDVVILDGPLGAGKTTLTPVSYTHLTLPTNREV